MINATVVVGCYSEEGFLQQHFQGSVSEQLLPPLCLKVNACYHLAGISLIPVDLSQPRVLFFGKGGRSADFVTPAAFYRGEVPFSVITEEESLQMSIRKAGVDACFSRAMEEVLQQWLSDGEMQAVALTYTYIPQGAVRTHVWAKPRVPRLKLRERVSCRAEVE